MVKENTMKQTEIGLLPEDWEVLELSKIGTFKNGINKGAEDFGFGSPFVNLMDVFGKNVINSNISFGLINSNNAEKEMYNVRSGDVIFIRSSVKPSGVGKTVLIQNDLKDTVYSGFLIRYRNNSLYDNFKRYCFDAEYFRNNVIAGSTVSANTNINQDTLKSLKLAFPKSLPEQELIAEALSDADAWIESLEQLIAKKRHIKQGAMQELLSPKEHWEVKKLGEVGEIITGGTPSTIIAEFWNGDIPWITPTDINISKDIYSGERSITAFGVGQIRKLRKNSLLVTCIASIGKNAILRVDGACNQQINAITPNALFNVEYLYYLLELNKKILIGKAGTTATLILSKAEFSLIEFKFPVLTEQTNVATILSDMDAELEVLEAQLAKARQVKQGMMQELLTGRTRLI